MLSPLGSPLFSAWNSNGAPLSGGKLYCYEAGTTTAKATYADASGASANTFPVVLNARGEAPVFFSGAAKFVLTDASDVEIWTADYVGGNGVAEVSSMDGLRALGVPAGLVSINLLGYYTAGDGGGGQFYWDAASTASDNGGTIILPTGYTGTGRWIRNVSGAVSVMWFGAVGDGVADDTIPIQNATNSGIPLVNGSPGKVYKITGTLQWNSASCDIDGCNSTFDFSSATGIDYAVVFSDTAATVRRKKFSNVTMRGPASAASVDGFCLHSTISSAVTNLSFEQLTMIDFDNQLAFGSNCSNVYFQNCHFTNQVEYKGATCINILPSPSNAGEQFSFSQCQFNNVKTIVVCNGGLAGGVNFKQCALVYFEKCVDIQAPCRVSLDQCSIENHSHTYNWFVAKGNGALIRIRDSEFWFTADSVTKEIFLSDSTAVFGGIHIEDCLYNSPHFSIDFWAAQTSLGPITVRNWRNYDGQARRPFGKNKGVQLEAWPTSDSRFGTTYIKGPGDASTISVSTTEIYDGNTTAISTSAVGQETKLYRKYPVGTGQNISGSVYIKSEGFAADGTVFTISLSVLDSTGATVGSGTVFNSSSVGDATSFTRVGLEWYPLANAGAVTYQVHIYAQPNKTGTARTIYLGQMVINAD